MAVTWETAALFALTCPVIPFTWSLSPQSETVSADAGSRCDAGREKGDGGGGTLGHERTAARESGEV